MVEIISEWGQSHRGDLETAKRQALAAKTAGCHFSKWQIFRPDRIASRHAKRYWDAGLGGSESQLDTFTKNGMLSRDDWAELAIYCRGIEVGFLCTPFDLEAVDLLEEVGVSAYKIASGDITYVQLLNRIGATGKPVFLSTGASRPDEIRDALDRLSNVPVTLLACSLAYPCGVGDAQLRRIPVLQEMFGCRVGYSDHTLPAETALAAVALGAVVLEKHCTLDPDGGVPDDRMALHFSELRHYVSLANLGARLAGNGAFGGSTAEEAARIGARRSIYAARDIKQGDVYVPRHFAFLRPFDVDGYAPGAVDHLYGTLAPADVAKGELIRPH